MTDKKTTPGKDSLLTFPCDFPLKIFGLANTTFEATAVKIIRKYIPGFTETVLNARPSENGKYLALSLTIHVDSREQLDSIYRELTASPDIIMVL